MTEPTNRRPDPQERATYLYKRLHSIEPKPTTWDLVCFCIETLAMLTTQYEVFKPITFRLISMCYTFHNNTPEPLSSCLSQPFTGQDAPMEEQKS